MNLTDDLFTAITREVEARERQFAAAERLNRRRAEIAAEITRIEARREQERGEIARRAAEDRAAIEQRRAAEIAGIERKLQRATANAIAERDALAARQAREAAADQRVAADDAARLRFDHLQTALNRESRALDAHYADRIGALIASTRREEVELAAAADRAERTRLAVAQIGGVWREQQETAHQTSLYSIMQFGLSIAESRFQQFINTLIRAIPAAARSGTGGVQVTVEAYSPKAIRQAVDTRLAEYFRRAGYTED
jgi:hypothetical protein